MSDDSSELIKQGSRLFGQGNFQAAIGCYTQAADLARRNGETSTELWALAELPVCWANLGESNRMAEAATRLLTMARRIGGANCEMRSAFRLAGGVAAINRHAGWPEISIVLQVGPQAALQLGKVAFELHHLFMLGDYDRKGGQAEQGYGWFQYACNPLGSDVQQKHPYCASICQSLSGLACHTGSDAEALFYARTVAREVLNTGNPFCLASGDVALAQTDLARGEDAVSMRTIEGVLLGAREQPWHAIEQGEYLRSKALFHFGLAAGAYTAQTRALKHATASNMRAAEVGCLTNVGRALSAQGKYDIARHTLSAAKLRPDVQLRRPQCLAEARLRTIIASGATP